MNFIFHCRDWQMECEKVSDFLKQARWPELSILKMFLHHSLDKSVAAETPPWRNGTKRHGAVPQDQIGFLWKKITASKHHASLNLNMFDWPSYENKIWNFHKFPGAGSMIHHFIRWLFIVRWPTSRFHKLVTVVYVEFFGFLRLKHHLFSCQEFWAFKNGILKNNLLCQPQSF